MPPSCSPGLAAAVVGDRRVGCRGAGIGLRAGRYPDGYLSGHAPWAQKCAAKNRPGDQSMPARGEYSSVLRIPPPLRFKSYETKSPARCEQRLQFGSRKFAKANSNFRPLLSVAGGRHDLPGGSVRCMFSPLRCRTEPSIRAVMADQIVITEKSSQAKDVRAAVGSRYGDVLPAEGHLFDLLEPEDVVPAWKRWSPILLRPEGLYGTRPAEGGNKAAKLRAIREALRTAKRVWLATDCDREGQLIGQEILEHYKYRGQVMRVMFTAQDSQTIRDAFGRAKPNSDYSRLYAAAVARRRADQIYNLSLTRTATVILGQGARRVIGVGRVKTPTLAILCRRELEIRTFVPIAYFEGVATAKVAGGQFQMRHAPQDRIVRRGIAQDVVNAAQDFEGPLAVRVEDKRQLHDLPSLQKLCGSRFGWPASKTLAVAQELYDGPVRRGA
jgi:DNA topoisomerase/Toprim domain